MDGVRDGKSKVNMDYNCLDRAIDGARWSKKRLKLFGWGKRCRMMEYSCLD